MRWLLAFLAVLLLVWLASGDARGAPAPVAGDIRSAKLAAPGPGVVGMWVMLAPTACAAGVLEAHFLYGDGVVVVKRALPPCPSEPVFLGAPAPPLAPGVAGVATQAFVLERSDWFGAGQESGVVQRYPAGAGYLPALEVQKAVVAWAPIAWNGADAAAVAGLWAVAWWRDPSRRA